MSDRKMCPLHFVRIPVSDIAQCIEGDCAWWVPLLEDVITGGPLPGGACACFILAYDAAQRLARSWASKKSGVEYHVG